MRTVAMGAVLIGIAACMGCGRGSPPAATAAETIAVVATVTDLASLAREVGGERVSVECLVPGDGDPHEFEVRASDIRRVAGARLVLLVGHETEAGWLPKLLAASSNARVAAGTDGYQDLGVGADAIIEAPSGDGHEHGHSHHPGANPHYLLDPLEGLRVAGEIAARLAAIDPAHADHYRARLADFADRLGRRLVGDEAGRSLGSARVAELVRAGTLPTDQALGGWILAMRTASPRAVAGDHDHWAYFARRFGVSIVGHLEPEPGVDPTPRHHEELIATMTAAGAKAIWMSPYFDPRHAQVVLERTGARAVPLAHQTGARPGAEDYLALFDTNVRAIREAAALGADAGSGR